MSEHPNGDECRMPPRETAYLPSPAPPPWVRSKASAAQWLAAVAALGSFATAVLTAGVAYHSYQNAKRAYDASVAPHVFPRLVVKGRDVAQNTVRVAVAFENAGEGPASGFGFTCKWVIRYPDRATIAGIEYKTTRRATRRPTTGVLGPKEQQVITLVVNNLSRMVSGQDRVVVAVRFRYRGVNYRRYRVEKRYVFNPATGEFDILGGAYRDEPQDSQQAVTR